MNLPSPTQPFDLEGKRALVTGAHGDIGRAIAVALAKRGAELTLITRDEDTRARVAADAELRQAQVLAIDLASPSSIGAASLPDVDVLVHAAAAYSRYRRVEYGSAADEAAVLDVGLRAALALTRRTVPGMHARGYGRVVLIGSTAADRGATGQAVYAAVKASYLGLARSLALEYGRQGVTANVVAPGLIDTARIARAVTVDSKQSIVDDTAVGRIGAPADVAELVAFLASPAAGYVTGACIPVDGGLGLGIGTRRPGSSDGGGGDGDGSATAGELGEAQP